METVLMEVKPLDYYLQDEGGDIYNAAIREWIAWQIRNRGHECDRGKIRNVQFDRTHPYGSEVTPAEPITAGLSYELKDADRDVGHWHFDGGWMKMEEELIDSPSQFVVECSAIASKLSWLFRQNAKDAMIWE